MWPFLWMRAKRFFIILHTRLKAMMAINSVIMNG